MNGELVVCRDGKVDVAAIVCTKPADKSDELRRPQVRQHACKRPRPASARTATGVVTLGRGRRHSYPASAARPVPVTGAGGCYGNGAGHALAAMSRRPAAAADRRRCFVSGEQQVQIHMPHAVGALPGAGRVSGHRAGPEDEERGAQSAGGPELLAALSALKARQTRERLAAGEAYEQSGLVVVDELGQPAHPES
ncbi:hypothetical protein GCM10009609_09880 [Pseudonocardia aurantiaca]